VPGVPALKRVGHKGADHIAPGNTRASFEAALAAGVDMIEFDVLPRGGDLVLAHDPADARSRTPLTLEEGLTLLADRAYTGLEYDVDLKAQGYEDRVVAALREHGLVDRALVSSQHPDSLAEVRQLEPRLRLGWSVPRLRRDPTRSPVRGAPTLAWLALFRARLPRRAAAAIRGGRCEALMAHWRLITPALVREVRAARGELYVWTVDEQPRIRALEAMGVTGVISNDPRLFAPGQEIVQTAAE